MRGTRIRSSERITPARTTSAVIGPGGGHHLVKARIGGFALRAAGEFSRCPVMTSAEP